MTCSFSTTCEPPKTNCSRLWTPCVCNLAPPPGVGRKTIKQHWDDHFYEEKSSIHCTFCFLGSSCWEHILLLNSCNMLYMIHQYTGGIRRRGSKLPRPRPYLLEGDDLRQGSNQVRNQVLRRQGNFFGRKGRNSRHPFSNPQKDWKRILPTKILTDTCYRG